MTEEILPQETHNALHALGFFIAAWSILEASLEMAIAKQLGLNAYDGSVVTAGMQFKAKRVMLEGLLDRGKVKYSTAITILRQLGNRPERNDAVHSIIGFNDAGITFTRRKSDGAFKSTLKEYSQAQLVTVAYEVVDLCEKMKLELGISEQDYLEWVQEAHNAANKSS